MDVVTVLRVGPATAAVIKKRIEELRNLAVNPSTLRGWIREARETGDVCVAGKEGRSSVYELTSLGLTVNQSVSKLASEQLALGAEATGDWPMAFEWWQRIALARSWDGSESSEVAAALNRCASAALKSADYQTAILFAEEALAQEKVSDTEAVASSLLCAAAEWYVDNQHRAENAYSRAVEILKRCQDRNLAMLLPEVQANQASTLFRSGREDKAREVSSRAWLFSLLRCERVGEEDARGSLT